MVFKRVDLSYVDLPCVEEVTVRNSREDFALLWLDERRGDIRGLGSDILDSERRDRRLRRSSSTLLQGIQLRFQDNSFEADPGVPGSDLFCRYTVER